uniref:Uncharacterized protein n=1 Tax=Plectus sambesii TaxID=2011161 RepID=A0A914VZB7_9BILA
MSKGSKVAVAPAASKPHLAFTKSISYNGSQPKAANRYIRWNLLFTFIIVCALSSPAWISLIPTINRAAMELVVVFLLFFQLM